MKAKDELEFVAALIQEYTEKMPQATKFAVLKHAQACVDTLFAALHELDSIQTAPAADPALQVDGSLPTE